ncbi:MAG: SurA N-terminal domain-containing protein [Gammaproteobacteria bacterium]|jgi:peptidyl-prolyl cis-trans isomerase D
MLEWIRVKFKGIVIWGVTGIITIVFFLGTGDYLLNRNSNNKIAAKVNDQVISVQEINSIYNEQIRHLNSTKKNYSHIGLDPQKIKTQIMVQLINQSAITSGLLHSNFIVNNEHVIQTVKNNPMFQDDGKFSVEKYDSFFKHAPITELEYQYFLRKYLLLEQLHNSLLLSSFVPKSDINNFIATLNQTRDFGFVTIPFKKFTDKTNNTQEISEKEIENYYINNPTSYVTPEAVKIAYLEISTDKFLEQIPINQEELNKYYQEHLNLYTLPELVNIKHILISTEKSDDLTAKTQIEDILAKLKLGQDFNKLAKQYSQDQDTAVKGGDLGWIGKGETELNFEQAAFSLKNPSEVSNVIQTKFGYHIIQLIAKREAKIKNFEEVLPQVTENYKEELAQTTLQNLIEEIENNSLEHEDLSNIANKFNLTVQFAGPFTNQGPTQGVLKFKEVIIAAFDEKNLHKNSNLIKLADDRFIILRVTDRQPANKKSLSEAYNEIKQTLQMTKAKQQAKQQGLTLAKELLTSPHPNKLVKSYALEWNLINKASRNAHNINPEILKAVFSLSKPKTQKAFPLNNGDFIIVQLLNIHNVENLPNQSINQISEELTMLQAQLEQKSYEKDLIDTAKIEFFNTFELEKNF